MEQKKSAYAPFVPDYRIAILSAMGILGFMTGCVILFYNDFQRSSKPASIFHEIVYEPGSFSNPAISIAIDSLYQEISKTKDSIDKYEKKTDDTSKKKKAEFVQKKEQDTGLIKKLALYRTFYEDLPKTDSVGFTTLNNVLHFQITPDSIDNWDSAFMKEGYSWKSPPVSFYFKDKDIPCKIGGTAIFESERATTDIAFITKYPNAGVWIMLVLIFCSFCFLAISTAWHLKGKIQTLFTEQKIDGLSKYAYYWISLATALVIGDMALLWNRTFYDEEIVKNLFFLRHLDISIGWVIALGSIAGAFCLAGFIYTASMLSYFAKPLISISKEVYAQRLAVEKSKAAMAIPAAGQQAVVPGQDVLDDKEAEQKEKETLFSNLSGIFQTYFLFASIILSLVVLCTGSLFSTVNSLDFIKLLGSDWGYSPARNDFIYLYGGLYTIILLLVYIPARMRFNEANILNTPPVTTDKGKLFEFLKSPIGQLKGILVATSPQLVSLIQTL